MLIDAKTDVLLQTADCIISNPRETKTLKKKILLDPGSQKTYLSHAVKDYLKLDVITKQNVAIKTFGSTNGQLKEFCKQSENDFVRNSYPFLRDLKLADSGQNKGKIDLLIGADFYWSVVDGTVKRRDDVGPVALGSKLRWLLSGPVTKHNSSCLRTHTENTAMQIADCIINEKKIETFEI